MEPIVLSLERAQALEVRIADCEKLLADALDFADARWISTPPTFSDLVASGKVHVVNTSSALSVIARNDSLFDWDTIEPFSHMGLEQIFGFFIDEKAYDWEAHLWKSKQFTKWSPYVTAVALLSISDVLRAIHRRLGADAARLISIENAFKNSKQIKEVVSVQFRKLLDFLSRWSSQLLNDNPEDNLEDYDHAFFAYNAIEALSGVLQCCDLKFGDRQSQHISDVFVESANKRSEFCAARQQALTRLQQLFYQQMTFTHPSLTPHLDAATLGLSIYCIAVHGKSLNGNKCAIELSDDVLDLGLDAFFKLQQPTGFWDTTTPLLGAATGRIGCSSIELATRMLRLPRVISRYQEFSVHFDRLLTQLIRGIDRDRPHQGWAVDIRRNGNERQTWYGFFVFEYVNLLTSTLRGTAADLILKGFHYRVPTPKRLWKDLCFFPKAKDRVKRRVLDPRVAKCKSDVSPACSMILFGPPGTGKTSFASALAKELRWGLIEIGPGDFLRNGIANLFEQGDLIFQRLLLLSNVVVLFDEIDEFVLERTPTADKVSKFITTYMLPWVQRLRDRGSIVFIFATNHLESFDPAIRRPGRFDLIVPIGPVSGNDRVEMMSGMCLGLEESQIKDLQAKLLPQTTYGDIERARDEIRDDEDDPSGINQKSQGSDRTAIYVAKLAEDMLITKNAEWSKFFEIAKYYGAE